MPNHPTIYLASSSPRRYALMRMGGWSYSVLSADVDETPLPGEEPSSYVLRLAMAKAKEVANQLNRYLPFHSKEAIGGAEMNHVNPPVYILAADTTVVDGKEILGKPRDEAEAVCMLSRLRSRIHQVYSALALARIEKKIETKRSKTGEGSLVILTGLCTTDVVMRNYSDDEITNYVASGDALDKAGAYAIQSQIFAPVKCIRGCFTNVMGLPLCHVSQIFRDIGVHPALAEEQILAGCKQISSEELLDIEGCHEIWANQKGETGSLAPSMSFSIP